MHVWWIIHDFIWARPAWTFVQSYINSLSISYLHIISIKQSCQDITFWWNDVLKWNMHQTKWLIVIQYASHKIAALRQCITLHDHSIDTMINLLSIIHLMPNIIKNYPPFRLNSINNLTFSSTTCQNTSWFSWL